MQFDFNQFCKAKSTKDITKILSLFYPNKTRGKIPSKWYAKTFQIPDRRPSEGREFSTIKTIDPEIIDRFSNLSGDLSPLHSSVSFAKERGFKGRVVHGFLLTAYLSELVGVYFPGINSLIQNINIKFSSPAYAGDEVKINVTVAEVGKLENVEEMIILLSDRE